jgi:hypothetical protein
VIRLYKPLLLGEKRETEERQEKKMKERQSIGEKRAEKMKERIERERRGKTLRTEGFSFLHPCITVRWGK